MIGLCQRALPNVKDSKRSYCQGHFSLCSFIALKIAFWPFSLHTNISTCALRCVVLSTFMFLCHILLPAVSESFKGESPANLFCFGQRRDNRKKLAISVGLSGGVCTLILPMQAWSNAILTRSIKPKLTAVFLRNLWKKNFYIHKIGCSISYQNHPAPSHYLTCKRW